MFANSLKQGNAGLGQAIAYFTKNGYGVALPLTDSEDWDLIASKDGLLHKVQVKSSGQEPDGVPAFEISVKGGNNGKNLTCKFVNEQDWDLLFLYHIKTELTALIPKDKIVSKNFISFGKQSKYKEFIINSSVAQR